MMWEVNVGTRFNAHKCKLARLSSYTSKVLGEDQTRWRHAFVTQQGDLLVYTGAKIVAAEEGKLYDIRATVKRLEPAYGSIRISRPVITRVDERQEVLL